MSRALRLHPNVLLLGLVSFFTDVSSEMIFPLVPIFVTTVLGAPVSVVGLIEGVAEGTANLLKAGSGIWSDKLGRRKPFLLFGYGLSAVTKPLFALATAWPHVLVVRFADRVGKGLRGSARDAMVADISKKNRGFAFGYRKAMDSLGAVIGPLIAFFALPVLLATHPLGDSYRIIFALSIIPAAIAVALLFFIKEKERSRRPTGWRFEWARLPRIYKLNLAVAFLFGLASFSYSFFILQAQPAFALAVLPLLYVFYNFTYSLAAVPVGIAADKLGRTPMIFITYLLFAIVSFGLATASGLWFVVVFGLFGIHMAIIETSQRAFISDIVPEKFRGSALGIYQGTLGVAALCANLVAGLLWTVTIAGLRATFVFSAALAATAAILFLLFVRKNI